MACFPRYCRLQRFYSVAPFCAIWRIHQVKASIFRTAKNDVSAKVIKNTMCCFFHNLPLFQLFATETSLLHRFESSGKLFFTATRNLLNASKNPSEFYSFVFRIKACRTNAHSFTLHKTFSKCAHD